MASLKDNHAIFFEKLNNRNTSKPVIVPHIVNGKEYYKGNQILRENPCDISSFVSGCHDAPDWLVELAVESSKQAQKEWAKVSLQERLRHISKAADVVSKFVDEWAIRVALEVGKPCSAAYAEGQEVLELLNQYVKYASEPGAFIDERTSDPAGNECISTLRPYGVFGVISPFNYPIVQAASATIGALIAGNGVVIKTSHLGPWSGQGVYEMCQAMNLPTGLVNIIHGEDSPGKALVNANVDGVAFTGSVKVGTSIINQMNAAAYPKPVIAEMGGKNPVIVTDSADLEVAAEAIVFSAFDLSGQKCSALSRVLVTPEAHDRLVTLVSEKIKGIVIADPSNPDAFACAVVNKEALDNFNKIIDEAITSGFEVIGGNRVSDKGYFVQPAVVSGLPANHELVTTEHFLPFLTISKVQSFKEAMQEANNTPMGLTAGIFTEDLEEAQTFLDEMEAGCINVNVKGHATTGWWPGPQTFGGWKASGSTGKHGLGKWYVLQFARQQARKVPESLSSLLKY